MLAACRDVGGKHVSLVRSQQWYVDRGVVWKLGGSRSSFVDVVSLGLCD